MLTISLDFSDDQCLDSTTWFAVESDTSSSTSMTISTDEVQRIVDHLQLDIVQESTKNNYFVIWHNFNEFFIKLDKKPRSWEQQLVLFIGYLINKKRKSGTIRSYISAIKAVLRNVNVKLNPDNYLLNSLTRACKLKNDRVQTRLPICKGMLWSLLHRTQQYFNDKGQCYLAALYLALFSTTYYGLFRVGEVTQGSHPIRVDGVHIGKNKRKVLLVLWASKTHDLGMKPQKVKITSTASSKIASKRERSQLQWCPYTLLQKYIHMRPTARADNEPFFVFSDRSPVKPENMRKIFKLMLMLSGFDKSLCGVHSFHTGRSVDLLKLGLSVETIKHIGRWKSNAVFTYLKY